MSIKGREKELKNHHHKTAKISQNLYDTTTFNRFGNELQLEGFVCENCDILIHSLFNPWYVVGRQGEHNPPYRGNFSLDISVSTDRELVVLTVPRL